ncbi:hypothetical protein STEG23_000479, partial [Scotinomys teguina]
ASGQAEVIAAVFLCVHCAVCELGHKDEAILGSKPVQQQEVHSTPGSPVYSSPALLFAVHLFIRPIRPELNSSCAFVHQKQSYYSTIRDITQKGYEKKRAKLLSPYSPQSQETDSTGQKDKNQTPAPTAAQTSAPSKYHRTRSGGARDERYRSDIHTEAVQAALAKHKEQKMALPMPTKRRSTFVQSPADACTPPDTSSASEDEGSLRRQAALSAALQQSLQNAESWINRSIQGSSTSSSASSTLSHGEVKGTSGSLADVFANTRIENVSAPPDVTATTSSSSSSLRPANIDLPPSGIVKGVHKGSNRSSLMDTADGVPVNSRVSTKIQQLLSTLKRPKRPPLKEFFVDDSEEIVEVPQPDPNQPKPEGRQMTPVKGEPLGVICNWPPALESALQRWGSTQAKCPCLTGLDVSGKPVYTLTYGKLWSRSLKLAYTLLNKLGTKNEPVLKPGDRELQAGHMQGKYSLNYITSPQNMWYNRGGDGAPTDVFDISVT